MSTSSDTGNIFLTTASQLNREIYSQKPQSTAQDTSYTGATTPPMNRFQFDQTLLVRKDKEDDSSHLIHTLQDELSTMKEKMKFVIEKDEEIYRLQCSLSLLEKSYETLQTTQVTDDSLLKENMKYKEENAELQTKYTQLQTDYTRLQQNIHTSEITMTHLKKTILYLNKELQEIKQAENSCVFFNTDIVKQALNPLHYASLNRELDRLCSEYNLQDYHQINSSELHMILSDMISHCKYL